MDKLTLFLIAGSSILASSFFAIPAEASSIITNEIIDNSRPPTCEYIKDDIVKDKCNTFRLTRIIDEKSGITAFRAEFLFKDSRITYIVLANKILKTTRISGKILNAYPVVSETREQRGVEPKSIRGEGACSVASDYSWFVCTIGRSSYLYAGKPIQVQQNTETPQNNTVTSKQYVFNTNSHVNTNISVNPGDEIKIQASGRIRFGFFAGLGGPRGILFNPNYNYFVNLLHGQLMGRIRQFGAQDLDGWFPIGEGAEFVAPSQGVLEFAVNDSQPGDNSGSFRIEVTISPTNN